MLTHRTFWIALLAVTAVRVLVAACLPMTIDEPYYWLWAHHPAAGYYDHPPLAAWLGALLVPLGNAPLVVRAVPLLASTACAVLVFAYAEALYGGAAAVVAGLLVLLVPYDSIMAVMAIPEATLLAAWAWSLLTLHHAVFGPSEAPAARWAHAGLAVGAALLAKFTAFALPAGLALFFAVAPQARRRWLATPWPLLATGVALAVYAPFLWWNARHGWVTFVFQFVSRHTEARRLHLEHFGGFMGESAAGLSPLVFLAVWATLAWSWREARAREPVRLALCMSVPVLGLFTAASLFTLVQVYWVLCGLLALFPLMGRWFVERVDGRRGRAWGIAAAALAVIPVLLGAILVLQPDGMFRLLGRPQGSGVTEMYGMAALGRKLEAERLQMPDPSTAFLVALDFRLAGQAAMQVASPVLLLGVDVRGREALRWQNAAEQAGRDAVMFTRDPPGGTPLRAFDCVDPPQPCELRYGSHVARVFYLTRCYGFRPERVPELLTVP